MKESKIILIVVFMMFVLGFGIDLYTPSFPSMTAVFKTTNQLVQLTISSYFLGYVLGLIIFGPLMDALGRKKPLMSGLLFYGVVSLGCAFAPSISLLLILRCIQGICVSFVGVGFRSILADVFVGKKLATSLNYASMSYRISPIIAPFIGGFLEVYFGWSSNFYFLALLGLTILAVILFFLPETHFDLHPYRIKTILTNYKNTLKYPILIGAGCCMGTVYAMMIIFNLIGPFFLQDVLKFSPIAYGNIALGVGIAALIGSIFNRFLLHKYETEQLIHIGIFGFLIVTFTQALLSFFFPLSLLCFIIPVVFTLMLSGLISSNMTTQVLENVPGAKGATSALLGVISIVTTMTLTALSSYLESATIRPFALAYFLLAILLTILYLLVFKRKPVKG